MKVKFRAAYDFPYFFKEVLGFGELNPMQKQIYDMFKFDGEFRPLERYVSVLAPRQHGKTTFCIGFLLWIGYNAQYMLTLPHYKKYPWINCLVVSSNQSQSTNVIELLKTHIDTNGALKWLKPDVTSRDSKWSSQEIKLSTNFYIRSKPFTSSIRGGTYHIVFCDDLLRDSGLSQGDTIKSYMENIIPTTAETKGMQILVGTPQTANDLFSYVEEELHNEKNLYAFRRFQALSLNDEGEWNNVLWPERFSVAELLNIREIQGPISFAKEMLCDPRQAGEALWDWNIIEGCLDEDVREIRAGKVGYQYFAGVDVAFSESPTADFGVIAVLEVDQNREEHPRLVHLYRKRGWKPETYDEKLNELNNRFNLTCLGVEERGLSIDLVKRLESSPTLGGITKPYKVGRGGKEKAGEKERIITRLHTATVNGTIQFPKKRSKNMEIFFNELMNFGIKEKDGKEKYEALAGHDDTVDAVAIAYDTFVNPSSTKLGGCFI